MSDSKKAIGPVVTLIAVVIGFYCGASLLVPGIGVVVASYFLRKFGSTEVQPFVVGVAVVLGQLSWMLVAGLFGPAGFAAVALDVTIVAAGSLWLIIRPGLWPMLLLCVFQGAAVTLNILAISQAAFQSSEHKALAAHIALRLFSLLMLCVGYSLFKKARTNESQDKIPLHGY